MPSFFFSFFRTAYRVEVATFVVPVAGETASDTRLRERIDFTSNILFFIEDLFLALGPGHVTTKSGSKINVASSLLWVRHQLAGSVKELMIAKKSGWQVLRNLKNEVITTLFSLLVLLFYISIFIITFDSLWLAPFSRPRSAINIPFFILFPCSFQQLTGEHKQMAKAMAKANKAASKAPAFKKRSASSSNAPPPKRRSFQQDKPVVCFNCQQPGHISPRCPNRPVSSTPTAKTVPKK